MVAIYSCIYDFKWFLIGFEQNNYNKTDNERKWWSYEAATDAQPKNELTCRPLVCGGP